MVVVGIDAVASHPVPAAAVFTCLAKVPAAEKLVGLRALLRGSVWGEALGSGGKFFRVVFSLKK